MPRRESSGTDTDPECPTADSPAIIVPVPFLPAPDNFLLPHMRPMYNPNLLAPLPLLPPMLPVGRTVSPAMRGSHKKKKPIPRPVVFQEPLRPPMPSFEDRKRLYRAPEAEEELAHLYEQQQSEPAFYVTSMITTPQMASSLERFYAEEVERIKSKLVKLKDGTLEELVDGIANIENDCERRRKLAAVGREAQMDVINREFNFERKRLKADHDKQMSELKDTVIRGLIDEKNRARDLYEALTLEMEEEATNGKGPVRKVLRRRQQLLEDDVDGGGIRVRERDITKSGPTVTWELKDTDIDSDLALLTHRNNNNFSNNHNNFSNNNFNNNNSSNYQYSSAMTRNKHPSTTTLLPAPKAQEPMFEAYYEDDKLFYDSKCFLRGMKIIVEWQDAREWGYIFGLTPGEVWIRHDVYNGGKQRISIAHLAAGKCTIRQATNRD